MKKIVLSVFFFVFAGLMIPKAGFAATLQFDPASLSCSVGGTCEIDVVVDAGTDEILATDARITYDKSLLSVEGIADGTYFTIGKKECNDDCYIAGIVDDPASSKTGSGVLATITFKGKTNGTAALSFTCKTGETATDSNIAKDDLNATDIIDCSNNGSATITVGSGSTSSGGGSGSSVPTPRELPKTGVIDELIKFAVPGSVLIIIGTALLLL